MSVVYAESSAVLRWLLGGELGAEIQTVLAGAEAVVSSALTSVEVARSLTRLRAANTIESSAHDSAWDRYSSARAHWYLYGLTDDVLARAGQAFPREPVRALDAIHLATAWLFSREATPVLVLSVDQRIRDNAGPLGLSLAQLAV